MSGKKPRVWLKPTPEYPDSYTRLEPDAVADTLTTKRVLEIACPGRHVDFFHVYFMGTTRPRDDSYGVAAFSDDENMLDHAPGARDIYLLVQEVPLTSSEMVLALKDDGSSVHLLARPPCAPAAPKVQERKLRRCRHSIEAHTSLVKHAQPEEPLGSLNDAGVRGSADRKSDAVADSGVGASSVRKPSIKVD